MAPYHPLSGSAVFAYWPMEVRQAFPHLFEHCEYTLDLAFLRDTRITIMKKRLHNSIWLAL
jgi:hypothetical protein